MSINTEHLKPGEYTVALRNRCVSPVRISKEALPGIGAGSRGDVGNGIFKDRSVGGRMQIWDSWLIALRPQQGTSTQVSDYTQIHTLDGSKQ